MKLSIITAVYNRADTIAEACERMAQQDYADIEWVVIDGVYESSLFRRGLGLCSMLRGYGE